MAKTSRSQKRENKKKTKLLNEDVNLDHVSSVEQAFDAYASDTVLPKTDNQKLYINSIMSNTLTIGCGAAGTGKTFLAVNCAIDMLMNKEVRKIVITRPAVESGRSLGALPGELDEKMEPYIAPVIDILNERLGKSRVEWLLKRGVIACEPLNFLRGKTFNDTCIILDEAQNTTPTEMLTVLTRVGLYSKLIINGDQAQKDLKCASGLDDCINRLKGMPNTGITYFTINDIVRSGFVRDVLIRYQN